MNIALWIVQILLGLMFLNGGVTKVFSYEKAKLPLPKGMVTFIGVSELLGAVGLILPFATGITTILTPIAAIGVAVIMVLGAGYHAKRKEYQGVVATIIILALAIFVAIGRW